ncbi:sensor histidine kinase [Streptomyces odontomachi]|uniref:sensor histidine kinase n=1 Tax=Streptomyces odontomachi TaxID=2944940 RepID=UPI00272EA68A
MRLRLVVVFGLVALTAAVSASGIAYWLNREAVLTRTQDAALDDFRGEMQAHASMLSQHPTSAELQHTANVMADSGQHFSVLLVAQDEQGTPITGSSAPGSFTPSDLPTSLRSTVTQRQAITSHNKYPYHVFWQRIVRNGTPYLVGGARVIDGGPTGYMLKSLEPEAKDLDSLAWSLGIATALALVGAALLAQAAATTVLKPVHRLGVAARRLGEGKLDTRLRVSGTDELAELSRTFNRAAESLEKRVAEMSGREEASRRFVADMSHELRTPLTAITAVTEVLEEELDAETGGIDPMIEPAVRLVVSETRRLNNLVENLMEVTRFDAGTARLVLDDVDIADQITACIDARAWLDAVELDAERGIMARIDPRRLDVILANLIGNALKHGGSPVRVAVRTERRGAPSGREHPAHRDTAPRYGAQSSGVLYGSGGAVYGSSGDEDVVAAADEEYVVIAVRDHGPGIPEEVLPHVFDRFYKASASRPRSDGSGLGLSIAQENAHIHGGQITVGNAPDGGAVFTLRLPRHTMPPDERGNETESGGRSTGAGATRGRRAGDDAAAAAGTGHDHGTEAQPKTGSGPGQDASGKSMTGAEKVQDTGDRPEDVVDGPEGGARAAGTDDAEGDT